MNGWKIYQHFASLWGCLHILSNQSWETEGHMMTNDDEQGGGKKAKKLHTMKEGE